MNVRVFPILAFVLFLPVVFEAQVAKCPTDYGPLYFRGGPNREDKSFVVFKSLREISYKVRQRVEDRILQRVGNKFRARVVFEEGIARDFDLEKPLQPDERDRIDLYQFNFSFRMPERGLKAYHFTVAADRVGRFIGNLDLPSLSRKPKKAAIIKCAHVVQLVSTQKLLPNFSMENYYVQMTYNKRFDTFAWEVSTFRPGNVRRLVSDHLLLNAMTGRIIKRYTQSSPF